MALNMHIEKYFGKSTAVIHEFFSEDIHADVSIIPPHEEHDDYMLATTGMDAFSWKLGWFLSGDSSDRE